MLSDVLGSAECETEDIIGESVLLPLASDLVGNKIDLNDDDRAKGSVVDQIASAVARIGMTLPEGWKPEVARRLAVAWSRAQPESIPGDVLDRAESTFKAINQRFEEGVVA